VLAPASADTVQFAKKQYDNEHTRMAARFVMGRAGTGKTQHCLRSIIAARAADPLGPPIFWILPKQATFSAERALLTAAEVDGFAGVWVISFDQLATEVLTECGGLIAPISTLARQMLLGRLLRTHERELRYFASVARQNGLAATLGAAFDEFERAGRTARDLAELLRNLDADPARDLQNSSLSEKLHDLHLLYANYEAHLGQEKLDPRRRMARMLGCIDRSKVLRSATVFVDGFLDYSDTDRRILAQLATWCASVQITFRLDAVSLAARDPEAVLDEMSVFHRTERALQKVARALREVHARIDAPLLLTHRYRAQSQVLAAVERTMAGEVVNPVPADGSVIFVEAPDARAEVVAAARMIREYVATGERYRNVIVLARSLDDYHDLLTAVFHEHDIPFFADRRRSAGHHPLIRFLQAALRAVRQGFANDWMIELMKTGLAGLSLDEAEQVENYVLLHRIRGKRWTDESPWNYDRHMSQDDDAPLGTGHRADAVDLFRRRLVQPLQAFQSAVGVASKCALKDIVAGLFALVEAFHVRQTLSAWITAATAAARHEEVEEHTQAWAKLTELLDELTEMLGDEHLTLTEFSEVLDTGLESFDLALVPPTIDQVLAGEIERSRMHAGKLCIVLGLSEGIFPRASRSVQIFSDGDRRILGRLNIELDPDLTRRTLDESILAYFAFTRASDKLCLIRPTADARGHALAPSPFWMQVREVVPDAKPVAVNARPLDALATPRQIVESVLRWSRIGDATGASTEEIESLAAIRSVLEGTSASTPVARLYAVARQALIYRNEGRLSPDVACGLFQSPIDATPRQVETFAACPFAHFASYGLRLTERPSIDLSGADLSVTYHRLLESIVAHLLADKVDLAQLTDADASRLIKRLSLEASVALQSRMALTDARRRHLLQQIERTVNELLESQRASVGHGSMRPSYTGVRFGSGQPVPTLQITSSSHNVLRLHGRIDRIDLALDSAEFAVIDYRLTGNALSLQHVYHGLSLQLLTYLLVLQEHGHKLAGKEITPVAGFYLGVMRWLDSIAHPGDATTPEDPLFFLRVKPRGIITNSGIGLFDAGLSTGRSPVINASIKKDGTPGHVGKSDVVSDEAFAAVLQGVRMQLAALTDRMVAGEISVLPYRLGQETPCPSCSFRSVCRFEVGVNSYLPRKVMDRVTALEQYTGGKDDE